MNNLKTKIYLILAIIFTSGCSVKNEISSVAYNSSQNSIESYILDENKSITRTPATDSIDTEILPVALNHEPVKAEVESNPIKLQTIEPLEIVPEPTSEKLFVNKAEVPSTDKPQEIIKDIYNNQEDFNQSELSCKLTDRYIKLMGHDHSSNTTGSLYSPALTGIEVKWKQFWTKKFSSYISAEILKVKIDPAANKTILDRKHNLSTFLIGFEQKFTQHFSGSASLGQGDELLYRALTTQTLRVDKLAARKASLSVKAQLAKVRKLSLDLELGYLIIFPFKNDFYSLKIGKGYRGGLEVNHHEEKFDVKANVFYSSYKLPAGSVDYTRMDLGLGVGVSWSFDK